MTLRGDDRGDEQRDRDQPSDRDWEDVRVCVPARSLPMILA